MNSSIVSVDGVIGDGPFIQVGTPTALATSPGLVVVGGNLGLAQWNGRSVYDRSDRSVGWFPVGIYRGDDLRCLRVLTSRWEVNAVAIHPAGRLIAVGTGSYDGGYAFEGELLLHDVELGTTTSVLSDLRTIEALEWRDSETLAAVVAPATDEDEDWPHIVYESHTLRCANWLNVDRRSINLNVAASTSAEAVQRDPSSLQGELLELSKRSGLAWQDRRQTWAVAPSSGGVLVGLESAVERWDEDRNLVWRRSVDGACTQLLPLTEQQVVAGVWQSPGSEFLTRPTAVVGLEPGSGSVRHLSEPGHPAVLVTRSDGGVLVRDTRHGCAAGHPATVLSAASEQIGEIELSAYDLFNHYFDIRRAPEFLILVGEDPEAWHNKHIAEVRRTFAGWRLKRLFQLSWVPGAHLFGGPGVFVDDGIGQAIVHSGAIHQATGLQSGKAFVVRRRYPDGQLLWHVPLDNQVTALDECGGRIVVVTNLGELVMIDAASGEILGREERLTIGGHAVVPLSLAIERQGRAWIGTLDGRVIQASLNNW